MENIVKLIAQRDHISMNEAYDLVEDCQEQLFEAAAEGNYQKCEDILADYLGLEPDYLMDLLII